MEITWYGIVAVLLISSGFIGLFNFMCASKSLITAVLLGLGGTGFIELAFLTMEMGKAFWSVASVVSAIFMFMIMKITFDLYYWSHNDNYPYS